MKGKEMIGKEQPKENRTVPYLFLRIVMQYGT